MALFKKKEKSKVDQALELMNSFTEEELDEFLSKADLDGDGDVDENDTTEEIEKAEVDAEEKGEEPTKAEIDESVAMQEKDEGKEDSQDAKDRVDEAMGEDEHLKEEKAPDHYAELRTEIDNLKKLVESLAARLDADKDNEDKDVEFGLEMKGAGKEAESDSDLEKIKQKYWAI